MHLNLLVVSCVTIPAGYLENLAPFESGIPWYLIMIFVAFHELQKEPSGKLG